MPKRITIKMLLHDSYMSSVPVTLCGKYRMDQVGTAALRNVRGLKAHEIKSHDAPAQYSDTIRDCFHQDRPPPPLRFVSQSYMIRAQRTKQS